MNAGRLGWGALLLATACTRDLQLPEVPQEGLVTGRVTYAAPGTTARKPAVKAIASLFGSPNQVATNEGGTFTLNGVEKPDLLHVRFDSDSDGVVDKERLVDLAGFGVGPHRRVDLGEITLGEYASVRGRILLGNIPVSNGHSGSTFFVPEGPYSALTNDEGAFLLPNLPEGPLNFMAFRAGYKTKVLGSVMLRPAEELNVGTLTLEVDPTAATPGSIKGQLVLRPTAGKGDAEVKLASPAISGTVADDLSFRFASVPSGLYVLNATRTGYFGLPVRNVVVLPGLESDIGDVELTDMAPIDVPDGGTDAGRPDAGAGDGGIPDAGPPDGGGPGQPDGGHCSSTSDCGTGAWCDQGFCAPPCSGTLACTGGRTCDPATNTCVRPCTLGCSFGTACDTSTGLCRDRCDVGRMCRLDFDCSPQGLCLPECDVRQPVCPSRTTCQLGACVSDRTCAIDTDCVDAGEWCEMGRCTGRSTSRGDAGTFTCATACDCRLGEWCNRGECLPDPVPTMKLTPDGGVNVWSALFDAGPDEVIALRSVDVFYSNVPFVMGGRAHRTRFGGGYVECRPERWVRSDVSRSTLVVDGGMVVQAGYGAGGTPVQDIVVQNFTLVNRPPAAGTCPQQVYVITAERPTVRFIDGRFLANTCGMQAQELLASDGVNGITVSDVTVLPSGQTLGVIRAVDFFNCTGSVIRDVHLAPQPGPLGSVELVIVRNIAGPVTISGCSMSDFVSTGDVSGIIVTAHAVGPLLVENNVVRWPGGTLTRNFDGINITSSGTVIIRNNVVDGSGMTGPVHQTGRGISASGVHGSLTGNRITPPTTSGAAVTLRGIVLFGPVDLDVAGNVIAGGDVTGTFEGISLASAGAGGPLIVQQNVIEGSATGAVTGIYAGNVGAGAQLLIQDNDVSVSGHGGCSGSGASALDLAAVTSALVERNRLAATNAPNVVVARLSGGADVELYGNHIWAGPNSCSTAGSRSIALHLIAAADVFLGGNTLEAEGSPLMPGATEGITCETSTALFAESNVIGGGSAATHRMFNLGSTAQACIDRGSFTNNYFWYRRPAPEPFATGEAVSSITDAGTGQFDARGNVVNANVSPFDAVQPRRPDGGTFHDYRLAAASMCIDRGALSTRRVNMTSVTLDLERGTRDGGAGPDIGCCERR